MEDILHLYSLAYNPSRPLVVFDERPCFLIGNVLIPVPMVTGKPRKEHYEYEKHGCCTVFLAFEPATGRRWVNVFARRSSQEYAEFMTYLAAQFRTAQKIVLVQDNLSTHSASSFYAHLEPGKALRLMNRFEFHFTPTKGSWLNMAELELSALSRQCLNRRIASMVELEREVRVWVRDRNKAGVTVDWQFSVSKARVKFVGKYPTLKN